MIKVSREEIDKIRLFETYCDEMINGKFILADVKISNILKSVAQSGELYKLFAECLLGFDFNKEFEKGKCSNYNASYFKMPDESYKRIALVFCFLIEVDNKKIGFYEFINTYFKTGNSGSEYQNFANAMLKPFKEDVLSHYDLNNVIKDVAEAAVSQSALLTAETIEDKLIKKLQEIKNISDIDIKIKDEKKEELSIYIKALIDALRIRNKKIITALAMALDSAIKKQKVLQVVYHEFTALLIKLY